MFLSALGYLGFGIAAWRPLPFEFFNRNRQMCTTLGCLLYFPGLALYWWGIRTLGDLFRPSTSRRAELYADHELRTSGPYALLRHPMYLGVLLAGGGAFLIFRTWTMAFYAISSLVVIARACREETALAEKFGAAWEAYRDRVPGWLPVNLFRSII
jgi:protein-S-isoprenylcysteine O-methyltransferase Ste14